MYAGVLKALNVPDVPPPTDAGLGGGAGAAAFDLVVVAGSLGGPKACRAVLSALPADFPAPVLVVQHRRPERQGLFGEILQAHSRLRVEPARDQEAPQGGTAYVAPADRQLLVAPTGELSLSEAAGGRCAADPLFASAAAAFGPRALAVVLSGTLEDGAAGAAAVRRAGGRVLAQDRASAAAFGMPAAAIATGCVDFALPPAKIAAALVALVMAPGAATLFRVPVAPWAARRPRSAAG